jgi:Flp pilus assembly protein TadD
MMLEWFDARKATAVGSALAKEFARQIGSGSATHKEKPALKESGEALQLLLRRADREVRPLRLNFYKRARLAHSFKWQLLENGVAGETADEATQSLVLRLSVSRAGSVPGLDSTAAPADRPESSKARYFFTQGNKHFDQGAYADAVTFYQELVRLVPRDVDALNNLGSALSKLGRYEEAEDYFRRAIGIKPDYPEAHSNLGNVLRWKGRFNESEISLRLALKVKPNDVNARANLGLTLILLGRVRDARARLKKVLKVAPRHAEALLGMGQIAALEGRFDEAEGMFKRVLEVSPNMPQAWAALVGIRKMTPSDATWLARAEAIAASGIAPLEESDLRFAIGKFCDDVEDFERAFQSYKRANELLKAGAEHYDRRARTRFVDDLIRVYPREAISRIEGGASASTKPVFVVGMMRSGTSLGEQIISSHPAAKGAGELGFWSDAVSEHETLVRRELVGEPIRKQLADAYLRVLASHSVDALRVVDKAPVNSDHLGVIHSVFPNARIIYMQRDPVDTCLSCYFQQFSMALNFTMDLSDLAHYYREHQRLMAHWRAVLPPGTIQEVPYAGLVADQEGWTRKILAFLGLEWDERCLDFHKTKRPVVTASYWQVRQKMYKGSVERWRSYEKFINPLLDLRK